MLFKNLMIIASANEAAERGLYGYSQVDPSDFSPYMGGKEEPDDRRAVFKIDVEGQFSMRITGTQNYFTLPVGTEVHCLQYLSGTDHAFWRVMGAKMPFGDCFTLSET